MSSIMSFFSKVISIIEREFSKDRWSKTGTLVAIGFFLIVVLLPTIWIFGSVFLNMNEIYKWVFADPIIGDTRWNLMTVALIRSFEIAFIVMVIDIIIGLPMAYFLSRYEFRGKNIIDALIDLPLAVPTSALGFSIYLFWGSATGLGGLLGLETGIFSMGPILIILAHVAFSYTYVVRSLKVVISDIDPIYDEAARTLGAPSFTSFRTVTGALMKPGLIAGAILAFTRSLGETGATLIVFGVFETAPILVISWRQMLLIPPTALLSLILVTVGVTLTTIMKFGAKRFGFPLKKVWPSGERLLSSRIVRYARDGISTTAFLLLVLIPATFTLVYVVIWWSGSPWTGDPTLGVFYQVFLSPDRKFLYLIVAVMNSIQIAGITTVVDLIMGLPFAFYLVRSKNKRIKGILDALVDVPLSVPTAALGFSLFMFWGPNGLNIFRPGFWLIVMVHIAFTFPYMIRPLMAVIENLPRDFEGAARILGAPKLTAYRKIALPMIKQGILASGIMAFMRSLGETGATIVVMGLTKTVPVLIVDWVESMALGAAAFASVVLIGMSLVLLIILRHTQSSIGRK